jgi:hypothetical protein
MVGDENEIVSYFFINFFQVKGLESKLARKGIFNFGHY